MDKIKILIVIGSLDYSNGITNYAINYYRKLDKNKFDAASVCNVINITYYFLAFPFHIPIFISLFSSSFSSGFFFIKLSS